jgi:cell division protease FtsH
MLSTRTQPADPPGPSVPTSAHSNGHSAVSGDKDQDASKQRQPLRQWPWWVSFLLVLVINYFLINLFAPPEGGRTEVSYTFFIQQVEAGNVAEINSRADTIQGTFKQPVNYPPTGDDETPMVTNFDRPARICRRRA